MPLISLPVFYCSGACPVSHVNICIQCEALNDSAIQWVMLLPPGRRVRGLGIPSSSYLLVGHQQRAGGMFLFGPSIIYRNTVRLRKEGGNEDAPHSLQKHGRVCASNT